VGGWRQSQNDELHNLYVLQNTVAVTKSRKKGCHIAYMGEMRNVNKSLVQKPVEKRPFRRRRHRWVDNIQTDLGEINWKVLN
jgi:hypothetical protein